MHSRLPVLELWCDTKPVGSYDDDPICAQALASVLRRAEYTAQFAAHFQPALAALEFDCRAGGVNGLALASMGLLQNPGLKMIYVTDFDLGDMSKAARGPILRKSVLNETLLFWDQQALARDHEFWRM